MNIPTKEMMLKVNENNLKINLTLLKNIVIMNIPTNNTKGNIMSNSTVNADRLEMIRIAVEKQYANDNK
jgi:hypothetical protein